MLNKTSHPMTFWVQLSLREALETDARKKRMTMTAWLNGAIKAALPPDTPDTVGQRSAGE